MAGQEQADAAGAATEVEDRFSGELYAFEHAPDLLGATGREISLAPDQLEKADMGFVIFRLVIFGPCHARLFQPCRIILSLIRRKSYRRISRLQGTC